MNGAGTFPSISYTHMSNMFEKQWERRKDTSMIRMMVNDAIAIEERVVSGDAKVLYSSSTKAGEHGSAS